MTGTMVNSETFKLTPGTILSLGIVGIMYLIYLDFGRGSTMGQKVLERMEQTILIGYVPCVSTFESFGSQLMEIIF
tara:strand:+ start:2984 stop:3211 length:228 start_codon:yes stop_codon:yes gene_type:complete